MKKTTKLHTYAALWLHQHQNSIEEIAKEIGLSVAQVTKIINKQNDVSTEDAMTTPSVVTKPNTKNLMITDSTAKKYKVAIMTKDASMANDELVKQSKSTTSTPPYIYRPNDGR